MRMSRRCAPGIVLAASLLASVAHAAVPSIAIYGTTAASNAGQTYTVGTIASGSTVQFDDGALLTGGGALTNNGLLNFNQTAGNTLVISNTLSGTGTLTLMNTGTLQLTGTTLTTLPLNMTINANSGALIGPATSGTQNGTVLFGRAGTGTLNVAGGLVATGSSWQVGVGSGTGTINVSSGTFAPRSHLILGGTGGGSGTLNVTGGVVTSGTGATQGLTIGLQLGMSASSSGLATITSGSVFVLGNTNYIGETGTGTVSVNAGGFLKLGEARLGHASTGVGTLNINTSGSADFLSILTVGGSGQGTFAVNGGMIQTRGGSIGASAGSLGTVTVTDGTWFNNGSGSSEAAGLLTVGGSGTGSLTIDNGGYVVVTGTFSKGANGTLTLNQGGTLQIGGVGGNASAFTVATTGSLGSGASGVLTGDLDFAGTLKFAHGGALASGTATYNGNLSGAGNLVKTGTGVLTVGGNNSYSGGTTLVAGALVLNSANAIGTAGTISFEGGTLRYTSSNTTDYSSRFSNAANQQYRIDSNGENITLASDLTSAGGSFTKNGTGTVSLTGVNSFASGLISGGVLVGNAQSLATSGTFTAGISSEVRFDQTTSDAWAGTMAGTGTFSKYGAGTLTLTGSAFSTNGTLLIAEGAVKGTTNNIIRNVVNNSQLWFDQAFSGTYSRIISGSGNMLLSNSGTITFSGTSSLTGTTTVMGGQLVATRVAAMPAIVVNQASVAFNNTQNGTYTGVISGNGSLEKSGIASVTLTGSNTYTGLTTVSEGKLVVNTTSLPGSANVAGAGTLEFDQATNGTYAGNLSGSGVFRKMNAGDLTLTGTGSNTGGWVVSAGRLIGSAGSLRGNITNSAAVTFDQATNGTYAGSMSGTGSLTKAGAGALTLSGSSGLSGATTVSAGTLLVDGTLQSSAVTVQNAATLGGNGTIGQQVTVLSGGTISPGNSPGILTVGSLELQAGSTSLLEIVGLGGGAGLAGVDYDQILVTTSGGLGYGGTLDLRFSNSASFADGTTFDLFSFTGSDTNFFDYVISSGAGAYSGLSFTGVGGVWTTSAPGQTITFTESTGRLVFTNSSSVPEIDPSGLASVMALVAGALGMLERRSRRPRG